MSGELAAWSAKISDGFRARLLRAPAANRRPLRPSSKRSPLCRDDATKGARPIWEVREALDCGPEPGDSFGDRQGHGAPHCSLAGAPRVIRLNYLRDGRSADEQGRRPLEHRGRARRARRGRPQRLRPTQVSPPCHHAAGRLQADEHLLRRLREEHLEGWHLHPHEQAAQRGHRVRLRPVHSRADRSAPAPRRGDVDGRRRAGHRREPRRDGHPLQVRARGESASSSRTSSRSSCPRSSGATSRRSSLGNS